MAFWHHNAGFDAELADFVGRRLRQAIHRQFGGHIGTQKRRNCDG